MSKIKLIETIPEISQTLQEGLQRLIRVFISYSRKDAEIAELLRQSLQSGGHEALLDQRDILPGEEWRERLSALIQSADAVVFCISPNLGTSEICNWEIGEAERQGKRLLPVVVSDTPDALVPDRLSKLNFIFMRAPAEFEEGLPKLVEAISTDIGWVRDHTRYGELAQRWSAGAHSTDLLLRGSALQSMQIWIRKFTVGGPTLTSDIKSFLFESEKEEARRSRVQKRTIILVSVLSLFTILIGVGWIKQDTLKEMLYWKIVMNPSMPSASREVNLPSRPGQIFADCKNGCPQMVVIGAGSFDMGSTEARFPREQPLHRVIIRRAFAMGRLEVTFEQWDHCVALGYCRGNVTTNGWGRGKQPVMNVSWADAEKYVQWLSKITGRRYRLPSEAEWEYAARAGSEDYFSFGKDAHEFPKYAWFTENSDGHPHPVGTKLPNKFGLFDMHGNVSEWTRDCANESYNYAPTDGSAWVSGQCLTKVFRGGSWLHGSRMARSANRDWLIGDVGNDYIGFRVVRDLEQTAR